MTGPSTGGVRGGRQTWAQWYYSGAPTAQDMADRRHADTARAERARLDAEALNARHAESRPDPAARLRIALSNLGPSMVLPGAGPTLADVNAAIRREAGPDRALHQQMLDLHLTQQARRRAAGNH